MNRRNGFTLIEMLVVMSVMGILLNVAAGSSFKVLRKSRDAALKMQTDSIRNAVHQYVLNNNGRFPENLMQLEPDHLKKVPLEWAGDSARGKYHYDPQSGAVSLYDEADEGLSGVPDSSGVSYGKY